MKKRNPEANQRLVTDRRPRLGSGGLGGASRHSGARAEVTAAERTAMKNGMVAWTAFVLCLVLLIGTVSNTISATTGMSSQRRYSSS